MLLTDYGLIRLTRRCSQRRDYLAVGCFLDLWVLPGLSCHPHPAVADLVVRLFHTFMEKFKITTIIDNTELSPIEWKTVPRIGETVVLEDSQEYKILDVVHYFRRKSNSGYGEISLVLRKKK